MPEGTAATPQLPLVSEYASFAAPAGVNGDTDKTQKNTPGPFGWLPHLVMTMDEATAWSGSSGVETSSDFATGSVNTFQEVSASSELVGRTHPAMEQIDGVM